MKKVFVSLMAFMAVSSFAKAQDGPFSFNNKTTIFTGNLNHWNAAQDTNTNLIWSSYSNKYFKINGATFRQDGKVGIGIDNPVTTLHVNGSVAGRNMLIVNADPGNDQTPLLSQLILENRGTGGGTYSWAVQTAAVGGGFGVEPNSFELWEYPNTAVVSSSLIRPRFIVSKSHQASAVPLPVVIDPNGRLALGGFSNAGANMLSVNGNVGIGTDDSKGYKLAVAGNMIAEKIKVKLQTAWPDYVFDEDYKPMKLSAVEQFIKQNKHLPGIPSAAEIKKNDMDVAEINVALLKKVEELTLHLIEMEKELKALKERVQK